MKALLFAAAAAAMASPALAACPMPQLQGHPLVDAAGALDLQQEAQLEAAINEVNRSTGRQLAVAIVPSLNGDYVENCANQLFRSWQLGDKQRNDGVLVYVAIKERKDRIEVGYGLEGQLTDARAHLINEEQILPRFKQGDMAGGLLLGVQAIGQAIAPPAQAATLAKAPKPNQGGGVGILWLLGLVGLGGLGAILWVHSRERKNRLRQQERRALEARLDAQLRREHEARLAAAAERRQQALNKFSTPRPSAAPSTPAKKPSSGSTRKSSSSSSRNTDYSSSWDSSSSNSSSSSSWSSSDSSSSSSSSFDGGGGSSGGGGDSGSW